MSARDIYGFTAEDIDEKEFSLTKYKGLVLLIMNVASECDFTQRDYVYINQLYKDNYDKGFRILAFPCNQFGRQEPRSNEEIKKFIRETKSVDFDLGAKIDVIGDCASPLFKFLSTHKNTRGLLTKEVKWNFTKFLIDRKGVPRKRFHHEMHPFNMLADIEKLLEESP